MQGKLSYSFHNPPYSRDMKINNFLIVMFKGIHENETELCETYNFIKKTSARPKVTLSKNEFVQKKMLALFPDPVNSFGEYIVPNPNSIPGPHQTGKGLRKISWNPKLNRSSSYNSNRKRELRRRRAKRRDHQIIKDLQDQNTPSQTIIMAPSTPARPDLALTKKLIETQNKLDIAESKIQTLQNKLYQPDKAFVIIALS